MKFIDATTALNLPVAAGAVSGDDKLHLSVLHVEHVRGEHSDSQARREVAIEVPADHILVLSSISDIMIGKRPIGHTLTMTYGNVLAALLETLGQLRNDVLVVLEEYPN